MPGPASNAGGRRGSRRRDWAVGRSHQHHASQFTFGRILPPSNMFRANVQGLGVAACRFSEVSLDGPLTRVTSSSPARPKFRLCR